MLRYILIRIVYAIVSVWLLSLLVFFGLHFTGDPARALAGDNASAADIQTARREFGLDKPIVVQYVVFAGKAVQGDFGMSITNRVPAMKMFLERVPASLELALVGFLVSLIIGLPLGILSAVKVNTWWDSVAKMFGLGGLALPSFWVGLLLILLFAVKLDWLPSGGKAGPASFIMPAFTLGWFPAAANLRLVRSSMLDILGSDSIKFARLKGLSETSVILKHAFKNALIPVMTLSGINLVLMFSGAVIVEAVFNWPGIGTLLYQGISYRDFPVVETVALMMGVLMVMINLLIDLLYGYVDPRVRYGK